MGRGKKKKNKLRVTAFWLLVIVFLFLVGGALKFFKANRFCWNGQDDINFVIAAEDVFLVSVEPTEKRLVVLRIPAQLVIEASRGYGEYRIGAIYELGELEKKGGELLRESVQEYFGVPVERYLKIPNTQYAIPNTRNGLLKILNSLILKREGATDFSPVELFRLWWTIRKVPSDRLISLDLSKFNLVEEKSLADGSKVLTLERGASDNLAAKYFTQKKIREENLAIKVVNATSHAGLANQAARIINNMGGRVVSVETKETEGEKCQVMAGEKKRKSRTVESLLGIFNCDFTAADLSGQPAEVVLEVGEEYWERWKGKGAEN